MPTGARSAQSTATPGARGGDLGEAFATAGRARRVSPLPTLWERTRCVSFEPPTSATMTAPDNAGHF